MCHGCRLTCARIVANNSSTRRRCVGLRQPFRPGVVAGARPRCDPAIAGRIWPVAESYMAMILVDNPIVHYGYQALRAGRQSRKTCCTR